MSDSVPLKNDLLIEMPASDKLFASKCIAGTVAVMIPKTRCWLRFACLF